MNKYQDRYRGLCGEEKALHQEIYGVIDQGIRKNDTPGRLWCGVVEQLIVVDVP